MSNFDSIGDLARRVGGRHQRIVDDVPALKRGRVWCHECGHTETVNSAHCLANGWPGHCGQTMSIDSPEERRKTK